MLYFLCIFALCGLLAPSQGSDNSGNSLAQINVCCGDLTKILADALDGKLDMLLNSAGKEGGGGAALPLGGLLNPVTNLLQLKNSKLLKVRASCTSKAMRLTLELCIDLSCLPNLLRTLPLADGVKDITVKVIVTVNIPLLLDPKNGLHLDFSKQTCNALQISVQVTGVSKIGALSPLTNALKDPLANLITPGLCQALSGAVGALNRILKPVGGTKLSNDAATDHMDYSMKRVRKGSNGCLMVDLTASDSDGPVEGPDGASPMPQIKKDGVTISKALIESCFTRQFPTYKINAMLEQSNCLMEFEGLTCMTPEGEEMQNLVWKAQITKAPKISMQYGANAIVHVTIVVTACDPDSEEIFYSKSTTMQLIATISHEDGCLTFTCVSFSIDTTMPDSSCKCQVDNAELKMAMENCAEEVAKAFMDLPVKFQIPNGLASSKGQEVKVMNGCVVVQSKEGPWKPMAGEATCGPAEMPQPPAQPEEHNSLGDSLDILRWSK